MEHFLTNINIYLEAGSLVSFLIVFLGGLLVSFTPCIYPLIPVVISYLGDQSLKSKYSPAALSFFYVLGISISYASLGLMAAISGQLLERFIVNPYTYLGIGAVFIVWAFSMLGIIHFPYLRLVSGKRDYAGAAGVFLMGAVSALIISPCVAPILGAVLVFVALKKKIIFGFFLLFVFALGMNILIFLLGLFSSSVLRLPKAGKWLLYIERILGGILLGVGIYFVFNSLKLFNIL